MADRLRRESLARRRGAKRRGGSSLPAKDGGTDRVSDSGRHPVGKAPRIRPDDRVPHRFEDGSPGGAPCPPAAELRTEGLSVAVGGRRLVREASLSLRSGELVALLGPNGAGKTTLLRAALGLIPRAAGSSALDGDDPGRLDPAERARRIAYLPQRRPLAWPNRVRDLVALGRFARGASPSRLGPADAAAVEAALAACGLRELRERPADTLSGGELARVHCARVFAARTPLVAADEPVGALDPRHQHRVMELLRDFVAAGGGALVVLHEIPLAARYADRIAWMRDGRLIGGGAPRDAVTPAAIAAAYGMRAEVSWRAGTPTVVLLGPLPGTEYEV